MKKLLAMALIGCMAFGMAACGSDGGAAQTGETAAAENASGEEAPETEEAPAADSAASDGEKVWVVATDTVFRPFEFTDEKGDFVGIDVDVLAAIAEDQGFQYELTSLGWDAGVAAVQAGQADALIAGATIKQERIDSGWIFSDGYYDATQTFVVAEGSDIKSFADLAGKNVAVKNGTAGMDFAESLKDEYGFTTTVFEDTPIMADSIKTGNLALTIPEGMESEGAPYGFAIMNPDNQELLDMFNAGLKNIKANGKYDEIIAKYLEK